MSSPFWRETPPASPVSPFAAENLARAVRDAAEATAICERLRELGVIEHATGDFSNVLKVKPPLCITMESADFFVDRLDQVLTEGW